MFRFNRRLPLIVFLLCSLIWTVQYTCLADDSKGVQAKDEKALPANQTEGSVTPNQDLPEEQAKQVRLLTLMMQLGALSEQDPNSPKKDELLKEMKKISAELNMATKAEAPQGTPATPKQNVQREKPVASQSGDAQATIERLKKVKPQTSRRREVVENKLPVVIQAEAKKESKSEDDSKDATKVQPESTDSPKPSASDDDIVQLKIKDNILDLNLLIEQVGKVMKFNFLFDSDKGIVGRIKMQKYGEIRRRDLLPLLESMLSFNGYTMIREDPFIRIVKRDVAHKTAQPLVVLGDQVSALDVGNSVIAQIVEIKHVAVSEAKNFLKNFADDKAMVQVPNTNTLIITEYVHRMGRLMEMLALVDQPGPTVKMETLTMQHTEAQEVSKQLSELLKSLNQQTASTSAAPAKKPAPKRPVRVKKGATASVTSSSPIQTGKDGPVLIVDDRINRLFVIGNPQQISQVKDLLSLLDVPDGPPIRLVPIEIKHVLADEVGQQIVDLIRDINKDPGDSGTSSSASSKSNTPQSPSTNRNSRRDSNDRSRRSSRRRGGNSQALKAGENGPFLHVDERTNRLLLIGSEQQIAQVQELLLLLDIPPRDYENLVMKVYRPEYVEAEEVRRILSDLGIITSQQNSPRQRANQRGRSRDRDDRSRERSLSSDRERSSRSSDPALLPGEEESEIRIAVQESTNKLFVLATEKQHVDIKDIMVQVDLDGKDALGEIQIYPLENREPAFVADMLIELLESTYTESGADSNASTRIPGAENAPIVVALEDIYAVAVRGSKKQHDDIRTIIEILDKRLPSVLVEAILVQVSVDDSLELGVSLQQTTEITSDLTNPRKVSGISPFNIGTITRTGDLVTGNGAVMAFFDDDTVFATLEALQEEGNSRIVSRPRILVNDNETGTIDSKREEPTTTTTLAAGSDSPITEFAGYESAGTTLTISPHIGSNESNSLQLEIALNVDSFEGEGTGSVPPPKSTNSIETWVTVPDGKTIVLGGLTRAVDSIRVRKVPFFGDIPIIGAAFRSTVRSKVSGVLYVFLKAHIVGQEGQDEDFQGLKELTEKAKLKLKETQIKNRKQSVIPGLPDKDYHKDQEKIFEDE